MTALSVSSQSSTVKSKMSKSSLNGKRPVKKNHTQRPGVAPEETGSPFVRKRESKNPWETVQDEGEQRGDPSRRTSSLPPRRRKKKTDEFKSESKQKAGKEESHEMESGEEGSCVDLQSHAYLTPPEGEKSPHHTKRKRKLSVYKQRKSHMIVEGSSQSTSRRGSKSTLDTVQDKWEQRDDTSLRTMSLPPRLRKKKTDEFQSEGNLGAGKDAQEMESGEEESYAECAENLESCANLTQPEREKSSRHTKRKRHLHISRKIKSQNTSSEKGFTSRKKSKEHPINEVIKEGKDIDNELTTDGAEPAMPEDYDEFTEKIRQQGIGTGKTSSDTLSILESIGSAQWDDLPTAERLKSSSEIRQSWHQDDASSRKTSVESCPFDHDDDLPTGDPETRDFDENNAHLERSADLSSVGRLPGMILERSQAAPRIATSRAASSASSCGNRTAMRSINAPSKELEQHEASSRVCSDGGDAKAPSRQRGLEGDERVQGVTRDRASAHQISSGRSQEVNIEVRDTEDINKESDESTSSWHTHDTSHARCQELSTDFLRDNSRVLIPPARTRRATDSLHSAEVIRQRGDAERRGLDWAEDGDLSGSPLSDTSCTLRGIVSLDDSHKTLEYEASDEEEDGSWKDDCL